MLLATGHCSQHGQRDIVAECQLSIARRSTQGRVGGSDLLSDGILHREGRTESLPAASTACKTRQVLNLHRLFSEFAGA